ncbi:MAG: prolipoprotein diacylglyceryl transferase [Pseudomonadota bacterium]
MSLFALPFPAIDPVAFELGPLVVRWYALSYLVGFVLGWRLAIYYGKRSPIRPNGDDADAFIVWAIIGTILGGRIGYVLFYNPDVYATDPLSALRIWEGGMAFHGGLAGMLIAMYLFARVRGFHFLALGDLVASVVPIGLFFGRIANFINGELYGRASDVSWAVSFPTGGDLPRHPSQLYEAILEGLVLFIVMTIMMRSQRLRTRPGTIGGTFLMLYGLFRFLVEFVREPDAQLGFLWFGATMGQLLSLPMIVIGLALVIWAKPVPVETPNPKPA